MSIRILFSPVFEFNEKLVKWLSVNHDQPEGEGHKRVLFFPIALGLRARTMCHTKVMTLEVSGDKVYMELQIVDDHRVDDVPEKKTYYIGDVEKIGQKILDFFKEP